MVNIDDRRPRGVLQGRQLVHPLPVIALIVGMRMRGRPAMQHECRLDSGERLARYQQIHVRIEPAAGRGQVGKEVRRPLEKYRFDPGASEGLADVLDFPPHRCFLCAPHLTARRQVSPWGRRNLIEKPKLLETHREPGEQIRSTRLETGGRPKTSPRT